MRHQNHAIGLPKLVRKPRSEVAHRLGYLTQDGLFWARGLQEVLITKKDTQLTDGSLYHAKHNDHHK
jgi:hypothetical protein